MATEAFRTIAAIAEERWGLVTTAQGAAAGVSRLQMSRMAASGGLHRLAHGVYRVAGAPDHEFEPILVAWMALGGPSQPPSPAGVPGVVTAGTTATILHRIGTFMPGRSEFIVPTRRFTRLPDVHLRTAALAPGEVTFAEGVPALTVERTIADMAHWTDMSLVAELVADAIDQGRLVHPAKLVAHLDPLARAHGFGDGEAFADHLFDLAGVRPANWEPAA